MEESRILPKIKTVSVSVPRIQRYNCEFAVYQRVVSLVKMAKEVSISNGEKSVEILQRLLKLSEMKVAEVDEMFTLLKNVTFMSDVNANAVSKTADGHRTMESENNQKMFPSRLVHSWEESKLQMKHSMDIHCRIVRELQGTQKRCWYSRCKATQYTMELDSAQADDLKHGPENREGRRAVINELKKKLKKWQTLHNENVKKYEHLTEKEKYIKEGVEHMAESLETDISTRLQIEIEEFMRNISAICSHDSEIMKDVPDALTLSRRIYHAASKHYVYAAQIPEVESPEFFALIPDPELENSPYRTTIDSTQPEQKGAEKLRDKAATFTVITDVHGGNNPNNLKLKMGQLVKQKCLSRNGQSCFGWTRMTALSRKKWGFYPAYAARNFAGMSCTNQV